MPGPGRRRCGDKRPPPLTEIAAEQPAVRSPWMVKGTVSQKSHGTCNVIVVVPHGHPKNDANTEKLGSDLAQALDAFAVINNQKYRRPNKNPGGKLLESPDPQNGVLDLNDPMDASECPPDFLDKILAATEIINQRDGNPALVFVIHGIADHSADKLENKPDIVVGKGFVHEYNPRTASASAAFFRDLVKKLRQKEMGIVADNVSKYAGSTRIPPFLRWLAARRGLTVEAAQIEFRWRDYRKSDNDRMTAARNFADVIRDLSVFASWQE